MAGDTRQLSRADTEAVRRCLARICASPIFAQAERQKRLLRYLVAESEAGRAERLKGYTIGVEVFDRGEDFDPAIDSIVRVEAARLRTKLREYYQGDGSGDPVRFDIPKGSYAVCIEVGDETAAAAAPASGERPALAVLPFVNIGADPEQEYFADGITEDLITGLSKLAGLLVIARQSAFVYKGAAKDAREIADELGVRYLVEGSVRRAGRRVRVTAQLIDSLSGAHIWAERYDRELEDIFAVQDDVTRRIVDRLGVTLSDPEAQRLGRAGTASIETHDAFLRGLERFWVYERGAAAEAQEHFREAVRLDPEYAAAHAWLARTYAYHFAMNWEGPESIERAFAHARRAVELDDHFAFGHAVLGWTQLWRKQGEEAHAEGKRAVALDPNNADAHSFLSFTLTASGRGKEALGHIRTALRLNPHPQALYLFALGLCYYVLGRYEEAAVAMEQSRDLRRGFIPNHLFLTVIYTLLGREEEAAAAREETLALTKTSRAPTQSMWLDERLAEQGQRYLALAGLPTNE